MDASSVRKRSAVARLSVFFTGPNEDFGKGLLGSADEIEVSLSAELKSIMVAGRPISVLRERLKTPRLLYIRATAERIRGNQTPIRAEKADSSVFVWAGSVQPLA